MKDDIRRTDPLTGEKFFAKRINQTFATPANRIKFHNSQANELRKETSVIDKVIKRTHKLIRQLMGNKSEAEFSKDYLDGYGVNLDAFNHLVAIKGVNYPAVYEFVIIVVNDNLIKIINYGRY